jgi:hypothetical protein
MFRARPRLELAMRSAFVWESRISARSYMAAEGLHDAHGPPGPDLRSQCAQHQRAALRLVWAAGLRIEYAMGPNWSDRAVFLISLFRLTGLYVPGP